jgi:trehalose 6-phosphate synthase
VGDAEVVLASNRGPVGFRRDPDGTVTTSRGAGGLVSALTGLGAAANTVWVCAALSDTDRAVASASPDGRLRLDDEAGAPAAVQMLALDAATMAGAYAAIANTTLWYLHHGLANPAGPRGFDAGWRRDWDAYVRYNTAFSEAISAAAGKGARILVQDYHLALVPAMLRSARPDLRTSLFTHTPWAEPRVFATLPSDVASAVLEGMLGADSLGFHSHRWAQAFVDCCLTVLDATTVDGGVERDGRTTAVRVHPLGVDPAPLLARAGQPDVAAHRKNLATRLEGCRAVVRVDRTEPSKNILRGLEAFRDLLLRHPEHRGRVVHIAIAYPSRQDLADYRDLTTAVEALADAINDELATPTWTPVWLSVRDDYAESLATLMLGDVVLVNPVRDGMNLVAKEAVVLGGDNVLVLSREAGAADELGAFAVLVDPFDVVATSEAMNDALVMSPAERARRHAGLVQAATALPPAQWLRQQLDALA